MNQHSDHRHGERLEEHVRCSEPKECVDPFNADKRQMSDMLDDQEDKPDLGGQQEREGETQRVVGCAPEREGTIGQLGGGVHVTRHRKRPSEEPDGGDAKVLTVGSDLSGAVGRRNVAASAASDGAHTT